MSESQRSVRLLLQQQAEASIKWLATHANLIGRRPDNTDLGSLFKVLVGIVICEQICGSAITGSVLDNVTKNIRDQVSLELQSGRFDPFKYDSKLILLSHTILSRHGYMSEAIDRFAREVAEALRTLPAVPKWTGESLLLAAMGYGDSPPSFALQADEFDSDALLLLQATEDKVRRTCQEVMIATHFGCKNLSADRDVQECLELVLPILLMKYLREYNLELGSILLRSLCYINLASSRAASFSVEFFMAQQRHDGAFGYYRLEEQAIAKEKIVERNENCVRSIDECGLATGIELPITISCLWALAETVLPKFRLLNWANLTNY